jgi:peroxiredoxin
MDNVNVIRSGFFAIDFALPDTNGDMFKLDDHRAGNFIALCFFPDGENERVNGYLKDLNSGLPHTASDLAVNTVGICPRRMDDLAAFKEKLKLNFGILSDHRLVVSSKYHVIDSESPKPSVYFTIFVIDDYGLIRHRISEVPGLSKYSPDELRLTISKLI